MSAAASSKWAGSGGMFVRESVGTDDAERADTVTGLIGCDIPYNCRNTGDAAEDRNQRCRVPNFPATVRAVLWRVVKKP